MIRQIVAEPSRQSNTFYKLTADMAKEIRDIHLTGAEWRFWSYLVTLDPFGDRYVELPDMLIIMTECGMSKATVYRAIAKFQQHDLFDFESQVKFRNLRVEKSVSKMRLDSQDCETSLKNETEVAKMREVTPETTVYQHSSLSQTIQSNLRSTNNTVVVGKNDFVEEEEIDQVAGIVAQPAAPTPEIELDDLEREEPILPTPDEVSEALTRLRAMGLTLNPTIRSVVKNHYGAVEGAIAHIKERIASGEKFRSIEGAFVKACKENALPSSSVLEGGIPSEVNPPSIEQMAAIEAAKTAGTIRDYYLSSQGVTKVVMLNGIHMKTWWEFLGLDLS